MVRAGEPEQMHEAAYTRERRSQVRGLLLLGGGALALILWRARPLLLFHPGWWRP